MKAIYELSFLHSEMQKNILKLKRKTPGFSKSLESFLSVQLSLMLEFTIRSLIHDLSLKRFPTRMFIHFKMSDDHKKRKSHLSYSQRSFLCLKICNVVSSYLKQ